MKKTIKKLIDSEVFRYLVFGGLTTLVSIVTYWLFSAMLSGDGEISVIDIQAANVLSWIFAVTFAYITNKFFVFGQGSLKPKTLVREILSFVAARLFSLVAECLWLFVTTAYLGINDKISKIIGQVFVVVINYVFSKVFIFKKEK